MDWLQNLNGQTVIFGGLTLVCLYMIYSHQQTDKRYFNHTNDTINKMSDSMNTFAEKVSASNEKVAGAIVGMGDAMRDLKDEIRSKK